MGARVPTLLIPREGMPRRCPQADAVYLLHDLVGRVPEGQLALAGHY